MTEDLENDKWVEAYFSLNCISNTIIKLKKEFINYAEELDWEVEVDKEGHIDDDGEKWFGVKIIPKGKKCSPEELREKRDLIEGFAVSIFRDIHYGGRESELPEGVGLTWIPYKSEDKKYRVNINLAEVFIIDVDLKRLIKLEMGNHNLSKKAFGISLIECYEEKLDILNRIFVGERDKAQSEAIIKILEENGMPKIPYKKKGFLKRIFG